MSIFDFEDYKAFVLQKISEGPNGGRGQLTALAAKMRVTPPVLSQIFRGSRDLSNEQGIETADFLGLNTIETEYFMAILDFGRASTPKLKAFALTQAKRAKRAGNKVKNLIKEKNAVGEAEKSLFYSDWHYSAVRIMTGIPGINQRQIAEKLDLSEARVATVLEFLIQNGLCVQKGDSYEMGAQNTHVFDDDPLLYRHHQNWRIVALRKLTTYPKSGDDQVSLTIPCVTSKKALCNLRKLILQVLPKMNQEIKDGESEILATLNIDLLKIS